MFKLLTIVILLFTPFCKDIYSKEDGVVTFDRKGGLVESTLNTIDNDGTAVTIDLGEDHNGLISIANEAVTSYSTNNGVMEGELLGYDVDINGQINAAFSNGKFSAVGSVALYHFSNDQGLDRISGTHFAPSANSGDPIFYKNSAGETVLGATISNHQLESSNVKMDIGMTELIILQRAYSANSKSVTTGDELIQKALNMDA
jgi:flagellar hook protein FlgE